MLLLLEKYLRKSPFQNPLYALMKHGGVMLNQKALESHQCCA